MTATVPVLAFDEAAHSYFIDGIHVPSVTEVLEDVGIIDYAQIPDGVRVMALERGRFVHLICQFSDEGDLGSFDPKLEGYLDAWRRFRDDYRFNPTLVEHRGYHQTYGFAGTLDRMGVGRDGEILLDIKTSIAPWWAAIQTAAYAAFFDNPAKRQRMAVAVHADGTYKVNPYRCADYARDMNDFHAALTTYRNKRRSR